MTSACLALALAAAAAAQGPFPYPVQQHTLSNGLRVLLVRQDTPGLAAYFTAFRVGSRNEVEPGRSGYAHLFEHLTFRGTRAHSAEDWSRIVKSLGLDTNAFTDDDVTAYWAVGPSRALPALVALEADRFMNLDYGPDDYEVETHAVLGEYLKGSVSPDLKLEEAVRALAFTRHTYRHTTIGFEQDVRRMPDGYRYSLELYRRFYRPDNAVVVVVGDFDARAVLEAIERSYGPWKGKGEAPRVEPEPAQEAPREGRVRWTSPVLPRLEIAWRTPGGGELDATAVQLVLWPYLFGPASALHRDLVLERQLVQEIGSDFQPHRDPFLFGAELVLRNDAADAPARAAVDAAVAAIAAGQVDAALLADVRSHVLGSLVMQTDTPYRTGVWLLYYTAVGGDPGYLDAVMRRAATVTPEDLTAFARRWLVPSGRTRVLLASEARAAGGAR